MSIVFAIGAIAIFLWLISGSTVSASSDQPIDPTDARQIVTLIGLTGATITDAAVAQFALRRFEETYGRKATMKDMAIVAGMMKSLR